MRVKAQFSMTFNLEKCIGCNTCTVACKNVWTNREGAEYMWWNNVETKPGIGYPKRWEDQEVWKGGWVREGDRVKLRYGSRSYMLLNLFFNPHMPEMADYYGQDVYTFTYDDLHTDQQKGQQPVARPKSMVTEEEDIPLTWNVNWEDNAGGAHITGRYDVNFSGMSKEEHEAYLKFRDVFYFYLPRICNHCLNPACVAACPSGAAYKREEDGIVLIDQDRCRNWRYCISSCPYKKPYYNWRSGKMEKCILCYPRVEHGLPPVCFHSCVGRIRSFGVILYDFDRVQEVALAEEKDLVRAQREIILDPFDPKVIESARANGISDDWIDAAQRSAPYRLMKRWELALPLHPEFRTLPMLWYIPPLAPIVTSAGQNSPNEQDVFDMDKPSNGPLLGLDELDKFRVPIKYLANLLAAGNEEEVRKSLRRQLAVRHYERSLRVEGKPNVKVLEEVGLTEEDARGIVRGLSLAFYHERFVVPTTKREKADLSPYTERGFAGYDEMALSSPLARRRSYHRSYHTPEKKYE
ncbi:MAG: nitrate reductase subunit beta [Armatimonadota bacterium]|nr:nitrate reductase subunit beta [Armatimonadota bacterium]MDR5702513.1 nitrate reductase subunit beta [Armatimonadota bacterium]MDR7434041.1 nitrate reductase subunit beta [Armatimonadota bacterium]